MEYCYYCSHLRQCVISLFDRGLTIYRLCILVGGLVNVTACYFVYYSRWTAAVPYSTAAMVYYIVYCSLGFAPSCVSLCVTSGSHHRAHTAMLAHVPEEEAAWLNNYNCTVKPVLRGTVKVATTFAVNYHKML